MQRFFFLCVLAFFISPLSTLAATQSPADRVAETVTRISSSTALYTMTFGFSHDDRDLFIPAFTVRNQAHNTSTTTAGYVVLDNNGATTTAGSVASMILSNMKLGSDGLYRIPAGTTGTFTFFALVSVSEPQDGRYSIVMSDVPFAFIADNKRFIRPLNPSELQYYRTPEIRLYR